MVISRYLCILPCVMIIDYSSQDKIIFSMVDYIVNMINDIPEDMRGESATPATHHLFGIADNAKELS